MPERFIIGAMSGTSADGVDAALVAITGHGPAMAVRFLVHRHVPFDPAARRRIQSIRMSSFAKFKDLAGLGRDVSLACATAARAAIDAAGLNAGQIEAIAAHGQTLFHAPPLTIQWFDPALLAYRTECRVISDFRRADCAAGGQGAPLVPFADRLLFRDAHVDRAVVNIGGIANVTLLAGGTEDLRAFDCGPGNCISDLLARIGDPSGPGVDIDGSGASRGIADLRIAAKFAADPYFAKAGPKSTDGPAMYSLFRGAAGTAKLSLQDELATACYITADRIAAAVRMLRDPFTGEIIISGGGTKNRAIMRFLRELLPAATFRSTEDFGIPGDAKEAVAFALLGAATLDGIPANVPAATGASRPVILGAITPRP